MLFENTLWNFIIINRLILWFGRKHQLHTQESLIFLMVVPYEVVVHCGYVTVIEDLFALFVPVFVSEQLDLCFAQMVFADPNRT